ncbi:hypothetical protein, partial [Escherichia coli]|uniref:hypothetical protein n=1 Tax=Escherichia coli TaxID=562 RepID=UPI0005CF2212
LSSLPPETYRQPVVLVCGDMSAHLFTDSPVRQVSEGLYLHVPIILQPYIYFVLINKRGILHWLIFVKTMPTYTLLRSVWGLPTVAAAG